MLDDLIASLLTLAILATAAHQRPARAVCPKPRWYLNMGIRSDGTYQCAPPLRGRENDDEQPPGALRSRIYCTGGMLPVVRDYRTVGCQRNPSS